MDVSFINKMKQQLEEEKNVLTKELESVSSADVGDHVVGNRAPKFPDYGNDNYGENTDSPAEVSDYIVNIDATEKLEARLAEVNAALEKMAMNTYGMCTVCKEKIPPERLEANPAASTCVRCVSKK
ncbi:MAG TPA: TraR/DksA C4-type zinc finger protein [Patescibacteria group bacterium]|nr:TraR/DksA C4-type zinc finger protein [Patescibacteria group bacterium]